jgi:NodT family efflux transporter outer membrane factor (OMF) lipoprotein
MCWWSFVSLLFLTGCLSMSEKEKTENILSTPNIDPSVLEKLGTYALVQGSWPKEAWWEDFQSSTLNQWITQALIHNPSIHAAEKRIEQARQASNQARSKLFPLLFFDAQDSASYFSENGLTHHLNPSLPLHGYEIDLSLSFQYEFDFWGKYKNLFRAAIGESRAKEAELQMVKLILSTSLAQSYFALLVSQEKKILYEKLCLIKERDLHLQDALLRSSLQSKIPPLQSEEKLQEAKQKLLQTIDAIKTTKHLVSVLMGQSPDSLQDLEDLPLLPLDPVEVPENISLDLLSRRPDLAAQLFRIEALSHVVEAAKADFFPNINLNALVGLESLFINRLFSSTSKTAGITPALHLPIFTAGSIRAGVKGKKALFDQAVFDYNTLILSCVQEVCDLLVHIQTAFSQKKRQENSVACAENALSLIHMRNKSGIDSALIPLQYEEEVIYQKIKDLDLLYTQYLFSIKIIKALGGGYRTTPPISIRQTS